MTTEDTEITEEKKEGGEEKQQKKKMMMVAMDQVADRESFRFFVFFFSLSLVFFSPLLLCDLCVEKG